MTVFNTDGTYQFIGRFRRGKPCKGWRTKDYEKLQNNTKPLIESDLQGMYTSISRYGSLYLKLEEDKKCRYYGYDQQGNYINQEGTWSISNRFVVLHTTGDNAEPFAHFLCDGPDSFIAVRKGEFWDPDLHFQKN